MDKPREPRTSSPTEECKEGVPTDGGWSWLICFSVFTITLLQFGHDQAIFVLFVDFVEEFQQPVSVMTSMFTIFSLTSAFSSLLTSNVLMPRFSSRQITCVAALLGSTLTFLLSQSPSVLCVLVVFGLKGLCFGTLLVCPTSLLGFYFERRRALATGLSNTGLCAAFIVFPGLTQILREEYGLRGTLFILSALELHIFLVGMFLRPVETYKKLHRNKIRRMLIDEKAHLGTEDGATRQRRVQFISRSTSQDHVLLASGSGDDIADTTKNLLTESSTEKNNFYNEARLGVATDKKTAEGNCEDLLVSDYETYELNPSSYTCIEEVKQQEFSIPRSACDEVYSDKPYTWRQRYQTHVSAKPRHHTIFRRTLNVLSECCKEILLEDKDLGLDVGCECFQSLEAEPQLGKFGKRASGLDMETTSKKKSIGQKLKSIFDISLLKIWPFRMALFANALGTFASYVNIYMPTAAVQAGLTKGQAASLLTVVGALDLCSRVALGYLADTGLVAKTKIVSACLACMAVLCHLYRFYTTYVQFLVYAVCVGLTCGCRHNLLNVILIDHLGVERLAKGLGLCSLLNTALLATNHVTIANQVTTDNGSTDNEHQPLMEYSGLLLDATGSFVVPFHFVGTVVLAGSLVYLAEPAFLRLEKARQAREGQTG
ncbi:monocarboxylate transporter [Elysia marginata]|uniref:Monocarboxylate transporter n=1 Tax=Elysia marginata TaxID=1093978 RepID=A0AAV4HJY6_9GAST|nr:monocarboxylate transporter [Elysia marginata]